MKKNIEQRQSLFTTSMYADDPIWGSFWVELSELILKLHVHTPPATIAGPTGIEPVDVVRQQYPKLFEAREWVEKVIVENYQREAVGRLDEMIESEVEQ